MTIPVGLLIFGAFVVLVLGTFLGGWLWARRPGEMSDENRREVAVHVVRSLQVLGMKWVPRYQVAHVLGLDDHDTVELHSIFAPLVSRGVLESSKDHYGEYRLPEGRL